MVRFVLHARGESGWSRGLTLSKKRENVFQHDVDVVLTREFTDDPFFFVET